MPKTQPGKSKRGKNRVGHSSAATSDEAKTSDFNKDKNIVPPSPVMTSDSDMSDFNKDKNIAHSSSTIKQDTDIVPLSTSEETKTSDLNQQVLPNTDGTESDMQGASGSSFEQIAPQINVYNITGCNKVILPAAKQPRSEESNGGSKQAMNVTGKLPTKPKQQKDDKSHNSKDSIVFPTKQDRSVTVKVPTKPKQQRDNSKHSSVSHKNKSDRLSNMKEASLQRLKDVDPNDYVQTGAFEKAEEKLHDLGIVILKGSPGSGKTTLALSLMSQSKTLKERNPLCLTHFSQFEDIPVPSKDKDDKLEEKDKFVVLIDDIFGKTNLVTEFQRSWELKFETVWSLVERGFIKLIITFRTQIYSECDKSLSEFNLFKGVHQINLHSLTTQEKRNILDNYLRYVSDPMSDYDRKTAVSQSFTELGFPQCCKFYSSSKEIQRRGVEFFKKPIEYLRSQFVTLKSNKSVHYLTLLLVMFNQGTLKNDCLDPFESDKQDISKVRQLQEVCSIGHDVSLGEIKTSADSLRGLYLKYSEWNREYSFIHQSVFDTLFLQFSTDCLKQSIRICPVKMLLEYVVTPSAPKKGDITVMVKKENFQVLAERFTDLLKSDSARLVLTHQAFNDESFVTFLTKQFWNSVVPREIVTKKCDPKDHMIEMFYEDNISKLWKDNDLHTGWFGDKRSKTVAVSTSTASIAVAENLKCLSNCFMTSLDSLAATELENQQRELLDMSCFMGNKEVAETFLKSGIVPTINTFTAAAASHTDDVTIFKTVMGCKQDLELNVQHIGSLLSVALERGNAKISSILIDELSKIKDSHTFLEQSVKQLLLQCHKPSIKRPYGCPVTQSSLKIGAANLFEQLKGNLPTCDYELAVILAASHDDAGILKELVRMEPACLNSKKANTTPFLAASSHGCKDSVAFLTDKGQNIELQKGLCFAAASNTSDVVLYLLQIGADPNVSDKEGKLPLHMALGKGMTDNMKALVENDAKVNVVNKDGETPLHISAQTNSIECVRYLVEKGANVNIKNKKGETPLILASRHQISEVGLYLLQKGADPNMSDDNNRSPLHVAVQSSSIQLVKALVTKRANLNAIDGNGITPLHIAAFEDLLECIKYLVAKGSNVNLQDKNGMTPLHCVLCYHHQDEDYPDYQRVRGSLNSVKALVENGANMNIVDKAGCTPLHYAAHCILVEHVEYLVKKGCDVTLSNKRGRTPLHMVLQDSRNCFSSKLLTLLKILLQKGANLNALDNEGITPLILASESNQAKCVRYLIEKGAEVKVSNKNGMTPLHYTAKAGYVNSVKLLVEHGADLNARNADGDTPLHDAGKSKSVKTITYLVRKGSNINLPNKKGLTPLHLVNQDENMCFKHKYVSDGMICINIDEGDFSDSENGEILFSNEDPLDSVTVFTEHNADVNAADISGNTPLHTAVESNALYNVTCLIEKGAQVNVQNKSGMTPLHLAAHINTDFDMFSHDEKFINFEYKFSFDILQTLLSNGASVNITDEFGNTALHIAVLYYFEDTVTCLIEKGSEVNLQNIIGMTPLHLAAGSTESYAYYMTQAKSMFGSLFNIKCSVEVVKLLVSNGASVNVCDYLGNIPLHIAAACHLLKTVEYLLEKGSNVNLQNEIEKTPLHLAAKKTIKMENMVDRMMDRIFPNDVLTLKVLISNGANLKLTDKFGNIALHIAAECNSEKGVKLLIEKGSEVNLQNKSGMTPLHLAAGFTQSLFEMDEMESEYMLFVETVKTLVSNGANVNVVDELGNIPLHIAAQCHSYLTVAYLIRQGSEVNLKNRSGMTPFHLAAHRIELNRLIMLDIQTVKTLFLNGASVNAVDKGGNIPLHLAAKSHSMLTVKYLIEKESEVNLKNKHGMTPLHLAASISISDSDDMEEVIFRNNMSFETVQALVSNGANVNVVDESLNTPLHLAAQSNSVKSVEYLIRQRSKINLKNKHGMTPLHLAASISISDSADKKEITFRSFMSFKTVQALVTNGANVNVRDESLNTPLHLAASISISDSADKEEIAFRSYMSFQTVVALVSNGANVNVRDESLNTPLHLAAQSNSMESVAYLITQGSEVNLKNKHGMTPLHLAASISISDSADEEEVIFRSYMSFKTVQALVSNGANVNVGQFHEKVNRLMNFFNFFKI